MTNKEAIQIAEERIYTSRYNAEMLNNKGLRKINENQVEWLSRIICLAKKQIPKKVKNIEEKTYVLIGICPNCQVKLNNIISHDYCEECGQAIDWSEANDK